MEKPVLGLRSFVAAEAGGLVGAQGQLAELVFLLREGLDLLGCRHAAANGEIRLSFVAAEVQDFKGAEILLGCLLLALYADQALACGVNGEFTKIGGNPFAPQLLGYRGSRSGTAEKVCDQIAFIAARLDDSFKKGFWLLGIVAGLINGLVVDFIDISPDILDHHPLVFVFIPLKARYAFLWPMNSTFGIQPIKLYF